MTRQVTQEHPAPAGAGGKHVASPRATPLPTLPDSPRREAGGATVTAISASRAAKACSKSAGLAHLQLADLEPHHCRYPLGHPGELGFHFCGRRALVGGHAPYCAEHHAVAYQPNSSMQETEAARKRVYAVKKRSRLALTGGA